MMPSSRFMGRSISSLRRRLPYAKTMMLQPVESLKKSASSKLTHSMMADFPTFVIKRARAPRNIFLLAAHEASSFWLQGGGHSGRYPSEYWARTCIDPILAYTTIHLFRASITYVDVGFARPFRGETSIRSDVRIFESVTPMFVSVRGAGRGKGLGNYEVDIVTQAMRCDISNIAHGVSVPIYGIYASGTIFHVLKWDKSSSTILSKGVFAESNSDTLEYPQFSSLDSRRRNIALFTDSFYYLVLLSYRSTVLALKNRDYDKVKVKADALSGEVWAQCVEDADGALEGAVRAFELGEEGKIDEANNLADHSAKLLHRSIEKLRSRYINPIHMVFRNDDIDHINKDSIKELDRDER